ncbi:MAG TPA: DUF488 domain-containing protein [Thermoanaerobaculia bacterium]|nr:DUF488 domain-containing protein [Thermoanaerobaculia bacterium]
MNRIYTIGHSTRTLDELLALLGEHGVTRLADIRRYPASRRHPHFSREALEQTLPSRGIEYVHFEDLGGRRSPAKDSRNAAWENDQFRGYADYMGTREFHAAVDRLLASERATAVMCAEAVPWRCHRNLLSDELVRRNIEVVHILGSASARAHQLSKMARIETDRVIYPPEQSAMF